MSKIEIGSTVTATITGKAIGHSRNGELNIEYDRGEGNVVQAFPAESVTLASESLETKIRGLITIMNNQKPYRTMTVVEIAEALTAML